MNERARIAASHLARQAIVYLRQSSTAQVEHNRESIDRRYALAAKARELGWPDHRITVIDEDLGLSGSGFVARSGFTSLTAEVALSHVGLVLGLEVSRLARDDADWPRLIDLGGLTDTLIGDTDGIYHPALFNDRLLLRRRDHERGRAACAASTPQRRHSQQSGTRRTSPGLPVGFSRATPMADPLPSRRSRGHRYPQCLCALCRDRLSAPSMAMVSLGGLTSLCRCVSAQRCRSVKTSYTAIRHVLTIPSMPALMPMADQPWTMLDASGARRKRVRLLPLEWQVLIPIVIQASLIGRPIRQTRIAWPRIPGPDHTRWVAP